MAAFYSQNGNMDSQDLTGYSRLPRNGCGFHYKYIIYTLKDCTILWNTPNLPQKDVCCTSKVSPPAHVPSPPLYSGSYSNHLETLEIWNILKSGFIWFPITVPALPLIKSGAKSARHSKDIPSPKAARSHVVPANEFIFRQSSGTQPGRQILSSLLKARFFRTSADLSRSQQCSRIVWTHWTCVIHVSEHVRSREHMGGKGAQGMDRSG